ncbi:hypothetical protein BVC80_8539g2 [Macleaya cordata]|uniref:Uncharacterized protein n=1 Tax=Macleaya cordata TaxID=56857 RepID=A0A200PLV3_MACCD|nr:hypothetical protein BVC80_8539g2 [Macleaya cordata]
MSKFCFSTTTTTTTTATSTTTFTTTTTTTTTTITHFSTLLLSDFLFFSSFVLSHPLYFSYFIFFSPYLLKLLSFLSPLFITTSLLLLALLTVSPTLIDLEFSESKAGFLLNTYNTVINILRSKLDDQTVEFHLFEQLEACVVVEEYPDEVSQTKFKGTQVVKCLSRGDFVDVFEELPYNVEGNYSPYGFLQVRDIVCDEALSQEAVEEKYIDTICTESDKDIGENQDTPSSGMGSEAGIEVHSDNGGEYMLKETENSKILDSELEVGGSMRKEDPVPAEAHYCSDNGGDFTTNVMRKDDPIPTEVYCIDNGGEYKSNVTVNPKRLDLKFKVPGSIRKEHLVPIEVCFDNGGEYTSNVKLGSNLEVCGSMRKEKEWKRTLACKLYEERQTVDGSEEGMDSLWESYETDLGKMKTKKKEKTTKKAEIEYYEDDEEEDEEMDGQICCLQALKFSTGKMNLGMRRPNLVRISKALKGIGWFHVSRRSKKV